MKSKIVGNNIREVWDFRLSTCSPILYCDGDTWVVKLWANAPEGDEPELVKEYDSEVKTSGDPGAKDGITACFKWLRSVRDEYSRDHLDLRKPVVKAINTANDIASTINSDILAAEADDDIDMANQKRGELLSHLTTANAELKVLISKMNAEIKEKK